MIFCLGKGKRVIIKVLLVFFVYRVIEYCLVWYNLGIVYICSIYSWEIGIIMSFVIFSLGNIFINCRWVNFSRIF